MDEAVPALHLIPVGTIHLEYVQKGEALVSPFFDPGRVFVYFTEK